MEGDPVRMDALSNYAPFRTHDHENALCFHLRINQPSPYDEAAAEHYFTDRSEDGMPRIELYRIGTEIWQLRMAPVRQAPVCCVLTATADFRQAWLQVTDDRQWAFAVNNAAMLLFAFSTVSTGTLEMHASVVKQQGRGYMFLGKSGTGKSTHARQWLAAFSDATLLNDDNPVLRVFNEADGVRVRVYGSPWSGKTPCYINDSATVGGIVQLNQAPCNEVRQMGMPEAYAYILSSASGMKILPDVMDALYSTIACLLENMPVHSMNCLPDADAARVCRKAVNPS